MSTPDDGEFQAKLARLDDLIQQAERFADPAARQQVREIVQTLLELHATGLDRLLEHVAEAGEPGGAILDVCAADDAVSGMLLLHGLHPFDLEDRVRQALDQLQPFLSSHGITAELLGLDESIIRLRLEGECDCASSAAAIRRAVEDAITALAPDAAGLEIEGIGESAGTVGEGRFALPLL